MASQLLFFAYMQGHAGAAIAYGSLLLRGQLLTPSDIADHIQFHFLIFLYLMKSFEFTLKLFLESINNFY